MHRECKVSQIPRDVIGHISRLLRVIRVAETLEVSAQQSLVTDDEFRKHVLTAHGGLLQYAFNGISLHAAKARSLPCMTTPVSQHPKKQKPAARKNTRQHLYADPLIYDILHQDGTLDDVRLFERLAKKFGRKTTSSWLEPACGSGRYLLALAKRNQLAIGLDTSADMLAYLRSKAKQLGKDADSRVKTLCGTMERFSLKGLAPNAKVDAAFNPINSIRHLATDKAMISHLRCIKASLNEDGVYIVGMSLSAYGLEDITEDIWNGSRIIELPAHFSGNTQNSETTKPNRVKVHVTQVVQFLPPTTDSKGAWKRRERVLSHLTISESAVSPRDKAKEPTTHHRDSAYWLRTYNKNEWETVVAKAGMKVLHTCSNTGEPMPAKEPGYYLYVLSAND